MINETVEWYENNFKSYIDKHAGDDLEDLIGDFLTHVPAGGKVLDVGCGGGRDSLVMINRGYDVTLLDASLNMCISAHELTGAPYLNMDMELIEDHEKYDGIWACASLQHVPYDRQTKIWKRLRDALKPDGVIYASYHYGTGFKVEHSKYYFTTTGDVISAIIKESGTWDNIEVWMTKELVKGREEHWVNVFALKR